MCKVNAATTENTVISNVKNDSLIKYTEPIICYTNTNVHIRELPTTKSASIEVLEIGTELHTIEALENGWSSILYKGKLRYIKTEYITLQYDLPFTKEELNLLYGIVNAEIGRGKGVVESVNVASVIFNRLEDNNFPDTISSVLKQKNQFTTYSNGTWKSLEITEETKLACMLAYTSRSTDALYFDSCNGRSWANDKRTFLFKDKAGHYFYK